MSDINTQLKDVFSLKRKIERDLIKLADMCHGTSLGIDRKFKSEFVNRKGNFDGLEDLYILNATMKKNKVSAQNALSIVKRMRVIKSSEDFEKDITEEDIELKRLFEE